jgi:NAD+--dinitrogen-reductase ADP-D-ribosyltransferase
MTPTLPRNARLPINRCNLPAVILGSLTFQEHPATLALDGVAELHADLFARLDRLTLPHQRADVFRDYITVHFRLEHPEEIGFDDHAAPREGARKARLKANWLRVLRGWAFDPDGREAAVLKGWVESRFGLTARQHGGDLRDPGSEAHRRYECQRAEGLYATNALESQLDLVYAYCQYEFDRQKVPERLTLYRGVNRLDAHEVLATAGHQRVVLLNNISSFAGEAERAGEFGDTVLSAAVPTAKVLFHHRLLPRVLQGEGEYLVLGGVYRLERLAGGTSPDGAS